MKQALNSAYVGGLNIPEFERVNNKSACVVSHVMQNNLERLFFIVASRHILVHMKFRVENILFNRNVFLYTYVYELMLEMGL